LVDFDGTGDGLGDPKGTGKAVARCARTLGRSGSAFVSARTRRLSACVERILACLQPPAADLAGCFAKAADACDVGFGKIADQEAKLAAALARKCSADVISFAVLRASNAANLEALADECAAHGVASLAALDDYGECLRRHHTCRSEEMLRFAAPRAEELLRLIGRTLHSSFCPSPSPAPTATP
jgi:hypothetical protein